MNYILIARPGLHKDRNRLGWWDRHGAFWQLLWPDWCKGGGGSRLNIPSSEVWKPGESCFYCQKHLTLIRICSVWHAHLLTWSVFLSEFISNNFYVQSSSVRTDQTECHPNMTWLPLLRDACVPSPPSFSHNFFIKYFEVDSSELILVLQIISSATMSVIFLCVPFFLKLKLQNVQIYWEYLLQSPFTCY
jgi:hypothetical protein